MLIRRAIVTTSADLKPFFSYYGGKWRAAPRYPAPRHRRLVEPFAGSAGYSTRYPDLEVTLVELDPVVCGVWRYLLRATSRELLELPDVPVGTTVDDMAWPCREAQHLAGFWLNAGNATPARRLSAWARSMPENGGPGWTTGKGILAWGPRVRWRLATQVGRIRHWRLIEGSYDAAPDLEAATWFIDPPYYGAGKYYRCGPRGIDYAALGAWCQARRGQVIVCENEGASWLPFRSFAATKACRVGTHSREAIWTGAAC